MLIASLICEGHFGGIGAGPLQNPLADRRDQAGRFGERNELVGPNQSLGRMPPADQRLDAADLPGLDVDHRLIVQLELLVRDGIAQFAFRRLLRGCAFQHAGLVDAEIVSAVVPWRCIAPDRRCLSSASGLGAVFGRHRNADAGADTGLDAVEVERFGNRADDPQRERDRSLMLAWAAFLDDGEFVAAEPRQQVGLPQRGFQSAADLALEARRRRDGRAYR